ncbi:MAG: RES family NAD+ phosphorylase [Casimicrobiaceae bacterium]
MSSRTWTTRAVASESRQARFELWRAVEAQHVAATMALVDSLDEQQVLERILDDAKPAIPAEARRLHWLLFTPFRYPPPPRGSRFRGPNDPGVFYGADEVRTACAELGYWRWRHLRESPALAAMPVKAQTVFRTQVAAAAVDLRRAPFAAARPQWTDRDDHGACQAFARTARVAAVGAIRYESVRDPLQAGCAAVLVPQAFARANPLEQQTWMLSVTRERVVWQRTGVARSKAFEFEAVGWTAPPNPTRTRR